MKKKNESTLTWDDLADLYDKAHPGGRPARTLRMETVALWAERQKGRFVVNEDGTLSKRRKLHMKLWLLEVDSDLIQDEWDIYYAQVVIAETEESARRAAVTFDHAGDIDWCDPDQVSCQRITLSAMNEGTLLAAFKAG